MPIITNYSWPKIEGASLDLIKQMHDDNFNPDLVVGITRGGLVPAVLISQYLSIPMATLNVSLLEKLTTEEALANESNRYLINEALSGGKILIVDDINDTGATINWIRSDWQSSTEVYSSWSRWNTIWGNTVKFGVITNNEASNATTDYSVFQINKSEKDEWIVHPWEDFWKKD